MLDTYSRTRVFIPRAAAFTSDSGVADRKPGICGKARADKDSSRGKCLRRGGGTACQVKLSTILATRYMVLYFSLSACYTIVRVCIFPRCRQNPSKVSEQTKGNFSIVHINRHRGGLMR